MFLNLIYVAFGGALGAVMRYVTGLGVVRLVGGGIPLAIITVNVIGSFLMGLLVVAAAKRGFEHLNLLILTGFLGGFTTFSAFSLETVTLIERGQGMAALIYVMVSVFGSILALALGVWLARGVWA